MVDPPSATSPSGVVVPGAKYSAVTNTASEDRQTSVGRDESAGSVLIGDKPAAVALFRIASRTSEREPSAFKATTLQAPSGPDCCVSWTTSPSALGRIESTTSFNLSEPGKHPVVSASTPRLAMTTIRRMHGRQEPNRGSVFLPWPTSRD